MATAAEDDETPSPIDGFSAFSKALERAGTIDAAWALMVAAARVHGYVAVDYGLARLVPEPPGFQVLIHLATNDWSDVYRDRGYADHDRFTRAKLSRATPYIYEDIWSAPPETAVQAEMEAEIRAHGVNSGLCVPLHGPGPFMAALDLGYPGAEAERARTDDAARPLLVLQAAMFSERARRLMALDANAPRPALSKRERECLNWVAHGKTAWETGRILSLSESAIKKHLASACSKLDARTRSQAVATALAYGLIDS